MATSYSGRLGTAPEEAVKAPCVVASTSNITLSGAQTIGTTAVVAGDRVLVAGQTDSSENGIYDATASSWSRATDWNDSEDAVNGQLVFAPNSLYKATFTGTLAIGTTDVVFTAINPIPNNTTVYEFTSSIAASSHAGIVTGHRIKSNYYDGARTADSGTEFSFTGTTTLGNATNVPHTDGYFYDLDGRQFEVVDTDALIVQFGALPSGSAAVNTAAIQAALEYCATANKSLQDTPGTFTINSVRVKNGIRSVNFTRGTIKGTGVAGVDGTTEGIIELDGSEKFSGTDVRLARISARIDMSAGDRVAIFGDSSSDCLFEYSRIFGFTNHATLNHYGILFWGACSRNIVKKNNIAMYAEPTMRGLGIDLIGLGTAFGGYFSNSGVQVAATSPCLRNIITDNVVTDGSYAVNLLNSSYNIVSHNQCEGQNHRSIYLAGACNHNEIVSNMCKDFLSSGVVIGYCSDDNFVSGNKMIRSTTATRPAGGGQGCVLIQAGSNRNVVTNNTMTASTLYGALIALGSSANKISGNDIADYYSAGVSVQSDWPASRPSSAVFDLTGIVDPDSVSGGTDGVWAYLDCADNEVSNNTIRGGYAGRVTGAVALSQMQPYTVTATIRKQLNTIVRGNIVRAGGTQGHNLHVYITNDDWSGTHDGSANAAVLTDSTAAFLASALIGQTITNVTDGSSGTVTANTATTITATLSGGTDDDWDSSDVYTLNGGYMSGLKITNNIFDEDDLETVTSNSGAPLWNPKIDYWEGNDSLDEKLAGEPVVFTDGDTTPDVTTNSGIDSTRYFQFNNSSSTSVTDFDGGFEGQEIYFRGSSNTTIIYNSGIIRTKGNANAALNSNYYMKFKLTGDIWFELWRSF